MMRNIQRIVWVVFLFVGLYRVAYSQVPTENNLLKIWDKTLGGSVHDGYISIVETNDDGFIIIGISNSPKSGDKSVEAEGYWIVKINSQGTKIWDKVLGNVNYTGLPGLPKIIKANDGNYIISYQKLVSNSYNNILTKIDVNGNQLWEKNGITTTNYYQDIISCKNGGYIIATTKEMESSSLLHYDYWVRRIDENGETLWEKTFGESPYNERPTAIIELDDSFLIIGDKGRYNISTNTGWVLKIDKQGNKIWDKSYNCTTINGCISDKNGYIFMVGTVYDSNGGKDIVIKIDKNGSIIWQKNVMLRPDLPSNSGSYTQSSYYYNHSLAKPCLAILENNTLVYGWAQITDTYYNSGYKDDYFIFNLDSDGKLLWQEHINKNFILNNHDYGGFIYIGKNTYLFYSPSTLDMIPSIKSENGRGGNDYWIIKYVSSHATLNRITGNIYNDLNANCQINTGESGLGNILVRATPGNYNTFTDAKGNYTLYLDDIGTYTVTPVIPTSKKNIITSTCANSQTVSFTSLGNIKRDVNFGLKAPNCANLTVDISSNRRRRCFRNFTTVKYANDGYIAADNVQLKVIYPKYVIPIRSSKAWTSRQDTVITYNLGRLEAGQTGQIVITDSVMCGNESIRGLTQCTKAIITPKSSCATTSTNWDKADLQAFSQCVNANTVKLSVINVGEAAMRDSTVWRLFLNGVLKQQGKLKLAKDERYSFEVLAKGSTVRLEANQTPSHPVGKYALTTLERCGGVVAFSAAPPAAVQLPINITPIGEETATSCMPIIDSYDPNDKQVVPAGVGANNIVRETDDLEFQIRFQNTGTDTAYTVVIRDTLSTVLDIASLQVGASSHNYTYTVSGKTNPIITWTFNNINLPAQKQDDAGSNGFVKFKIAQMPNNAKGTKIKNKAGIYFDFNSPIITNETNLTVGDLVSDLNNAADLATIFVCNTKPQPTTAQAGNSAITVADSVILAANTAEKGIGMWKLVQGAGEFTNPYNPKTTVKKIGLGENIYEWAISLCNTVSANKVKVTRMAIPKAEIVSKGDTLIAEQADSYQWFFNGQAIAGATSQTFIAKISGTYTVEIKKFGVTVTSPPFKHIITGIEDELLQRAISLVPNPTQSSCVLQLSNDYFGEVKISISNLLGQIVFQTVTNKNDVNLSQTIDLQSFANGVYLVQLQTSKGKVVKKLVKM